MLPPWSEFAPVFVRLLQLQAALLGVLILIEWSVCPVG